MEKHKRAKISMPLIPRYESFAPFRLVCCVCARRGGVAVVRVCKSKKKFLLAGKQQNFGTRNFAKEENKFSVDGRRENSLKAAMFTYEHSHNQTTSRQTHVKRGKIHQHNFTTQLIFFHDD